MKETKTIPHTNKKNPPNNNNNKNLFNKVEVKSMMMSPTFNLTKKKTDD